MIRNNMLMHPLNGSFMEPTPAAYKLRATGLILIRHHIPKGWSAHRAITVKPKDKVRIHAIRRINYVYCKNCKDI